MAFSSTMVWQAMQIVAPSGSLYSRSMPRQSGLGQRRICSMLLVRLVGGLQEREGA